MIKFYYIRCRIHSWTKFKDFTKLYKSKLIIFIMRHLSNKEIKGLNEILFPGYELSKKDTITEGDDIIYRNGEKYLIIIDKNKKNILRVIPHLKSLVDSGIKSVYVDHGAIPFIMKGADIMRPGIQKIEEFEKGETIFIKDEEHSRVLAVGEALFSSEEMTGMEKGIVVKVYHFLGDKIY